MEESLELRQVLSAVTIQLAVHKDTTIYESGIGNLSNGSGQYVVTGGEASDEQARRGLVAFDLSSSDIPQGAVVIDASLTLNLAFSYGAASGVDLFRVTRDWGEAGSDADANELDGAPALQFDATWLFRFYDGAAWTNAGGDFVPGTSASVSVTDVGAYEWNGEGLIRDVQHWLDNPSENFGWILLAASDQPGSVKGFESGESPVSVLRPMLEITYETPLLPTLVTGRSWNDANGDGLRTPLAVQDLRLTFHQGRSLFNAYGGREYWYLSDANRSWYYLTESGELTRWSGTPRQLTGVRVESLDARFYYHPEKLLETSAAPEPYLNGTVFELLNSDGAVVATTQSGDMDLNDDGFISPETERGWYQFEVTTAGRYRVRAVPDSGVAESATLKSSGAAEVWQLKETRGLKFQTSWYENVGFRGERWLKATTGWVFITPAGDVYQWSGRSGTKSRPVTGTWITSLGQAYYMDPSLILLAADPALQITDQASAASGNFGFYEPAKINGRTWNDLNGDGVRSPDAFSTVRQISRPINGPTGNFTWFEVTGGDAFTPAENLYFYVSGTQLFQWNQNTGASSVFSQVWGGGTGSPAALLQSAFATETWLNGVGLELLDHRGYVVAETLSSNVDLDNNQQISPATESGWYSFAGLIPGTYSIRMVSRSGWLASSPAANPALQELSRTLQNERGFKAASTDWYNFGGRQERWFQDRQNQWHFILPDGTIILWDKSSGGNSGVARGSQVARLSGSFYVNTTLLFSPQQPVVSLSSGDSQSGLNFGTLKVVDSIFSSLEADLLLP